MANAKPTINEIYSKCNLQPGDAVKLCDGLAEAIAAGYNPTNGLIKVIAASYHATQKDELIVVAPSEAAGKKNCRGQPIYGDSMYSIYLKNRRTGYYFACKPLYHGKRILVKVADSSSKAKGINNYAVCPNCGTMGQWVACALKCPKCWKIFG